MHPKRSAAVGLAALALSLGVAACDAGGPTASPTAIESTAPPQPTSSATTAAPETPIYRVALDVEYRETLRYPGSGHLPRELDLSYQLDKSAPIGELVAAEAQGVVDWTLRCFVGDAIADPDATPDSSEREVHPFAPADSIDLLPDQAVQDPEVDWLAGPGILVFEGDSELWLAHRLPSSVTLNKAVTSECGDPVLALVVTWGHGAMTAPARVNVGGTDYSRAEALNLQASAPVYLLDAAGDGWLLAPIPVEELDAGPVEINFLREESEPEGETRLAITGTITRTE